MRRRSSIILCHSQVTLSLLMFAQPVDDERIDNIGRFPVQKMPNVWNAVYLKSVWKVLRPESVVKHTCINAAIMSACNAEGRHSDRGQPG